MGGFADLVNAADANSLELGFNPCPEE